MKTSKKTKSLSGPEATKSNGYNLPSHNALAQILPNNSSHIKEEKKKIHKEAIQDQKRETGRPEATQDNKPNINHTYQIHQPHKRPPLHDFGDDHYKTEISCLQTKEVENYRAAISKMVEDIIELRTHVVTLEAENRQLHTDLSLHQELSQDLLTDPDTDTSSMTKAQLLKHIASLKFRVKGEMSKAASQRERIQELQNNLIEKNDSEKELLKLQRIHKQQQEDHQGHTAKMATLEATVKQQEKVIEKMEKALDSRLKEKAKQSDDKRVMVKKQKDVIDKKKEEKESTLAAENSRLKEELNRIHQQCNAGCIQTSEQEKQILLQRVEQAEVRAQTLEAQLEENSKQWGRQKQELLTKLREHRHGFVRTSTTIFHNKPPFK